MTYSKIEKKKQINDIALVRVEQLAPFPFDKIDNQLQKYKNAEIFWIQEEPKNMGAWNWIYFYFKTLLDQENKGRAIHYIGRHPSAATSVGSIYKHEKELKLILDTAFKPK